MRKGPPKFSRPVIVTNHAAKPGKGFTIVELLVSVAELTVLVLLVSRLFSSAASVTTSGNKRMDMEGQLRPLFDRMAIDLAAIVKRPDVDYFLKSSTNGQVGNDQMAFYCSVPGYYPSTGSPSPISLVAYRINSTTGSSTFSKLERMAKGLVWTGVSSTDTPIVFLPLTINNAWPAATNSNTDADYELIAPYVFRFEYYYLLRNGNLSADPWDTLAGHNAVAGMQDVAAISIAIAAIDPKSRVLISDSQLASLSGQLTDFVASMKPGELLNDWQQKLDGITNMPRPAISAIRTYNRYFSLSPKP